MMIAARAGGAFESVAVLGQKCLAQRTQPRIADRSNLVGDKLPVGGLFRPQLHRTGEQSGDFILHQRADIPVLRVESVLLVMRELSSQLDERADRQRFARFVGDVIAPDTQHHPIAGVSETEFTIRFALTRRFGRACIHLHVHARRHISTLRATPNFTQGQQVHWLLL
jgi:hypothetical protein